MKDTGERIKSAMQRSGLNQAGLARAAGITEGAVSRYISGTRTPDASTIVRLADTLNVTTDYILGRTSAKQDLFSAFCEKENGQHEVY